MKLSNLFLSILFTCLTLFVTAQNTDHKTLIGLGAQGANMSFMDARSNYYKNWDILPAPSQLKIFRYITKGFSIGTQLSIGHARRIDTVGQKFFLQWGVDLKYSFANGYILRQKCWFDPYLLAGGGLDKWGNTRGSINVGGGLNIWFVKYLGVFVQTQFDYLPHKAIHPETADPRPSFMHHSFGIVARLGKARDTDGDGVPDAEDACPTDPGKKALKGCPDKDGDGIIDKNDLCPLVAGIEQFAGCPDTDGDGIPDPDDDCPTAKGSIAMHGCPDTDGDGIADKDDACPTVKGAPSAMGCPDRDGDGIADKDDACPDDKGIAKFNGCPDTDGDGIPDREDKCPNIYGLATNHGCPMPALDATEKVEVQKQLSFAAKHIFFETGKDILRKESLDDLDSVVALMTRYDFLKVSIEGYTDNIGAAKANEELSDHRANTVMTYLAAHGILPARLTAVGYGSAKPIADNATAAGRAKNRRVEINIRD